MTTVARSNNPYESIDNTFVQLFWSIFSGLIAMSAAPESRGTRLCIKAEAACATFGML